MPTQKLNFMNRHAAKKYAYIKSVALLCRLRIYCTAGRVVGRNITISVQVNLTPIIGRTEC